MPLDASNPIFDAAFEPRRPISRSPVHSSNVDGIGYDEGNQVLEVAFTGGTVYRYAGVPFETYRALMSASSVGSAFARTVRGHFHERRMPRPVEEKPGPPPKLEPPSPDVAPEPRPRPPAPRVRVGPKPGPVEATIVEEEEIVERLADGRIIVGGRPCDMCGAQLVADADEKRAKAGLLRCARGHVQMSGGFNADRLEIG